MGRVIQPVHRADSTVYEEAQVTLAPPGPAWPRASTALFRLIFRLFGVELARVHNRGMDLIEEADPRTATETIDRWEAVFGLPDDCDLTPPTELADRQATLAAKVAARGGQTVGYLKRVALAAGVELEIEEYDAFRFEDSAFEDALNDDDWCYAFGVTGLPTTITHTFRTDDSGNYELGAFGDPLTTYENASLECRLGHIKPAHTTMVVFRDEPGLTE